MDNESEASTSPRLAPLVFVNGQQDAREAAPGETLSASHAHKKIRDGTVQRRGWMNTSCLNQVGVFDDMCTTVLFDKVWQSPTRLQSNTAVY